MGTKIEQEVPPLTLLGRAAIMFVWAYRATLGRVLGGQCRFDPSCSQYAIDAVRKYGAIRGGWKAVKRVGRCHPLSKGGWDPA